MITRRTILIARAISLVALFFVAGMIIDAAIAFLFWPDIACICNVCLGAH